MRNPTYDELLTSLYTRQPLPELNGEQLERFWLDSDRRLLEIGRLVWLHWPLAAPFADAHLQGSLVYRLAAAVPQERHNARDLREALALGMQALVQSCGRQELANIFLYDDVRYRRLRFSPDHLSPELASALKAEVSSVVVEFTIDAVAFSRTLSLYIQHHASSEMLLRLHAPCKRQVLLLTRRAGEIFARDVDEALRSMGISVDHPSFLSARNLLS